MSSPMLAYRSGSQTRVKFLWTFWAFSEVGKVLTEVFLAHAEETKRIVATVMEMRKTNRKLAMFLSFDLDSTMPPSICVTYI